MNAIVSLETVTNLTNFFMYQIYKARYAQRRPIEGDKNKWSTYICISQKYLLGLQVLRYRLNISF